MRIAAQRMADENHVITRRRQRSVRLVSDPDGMQRPPAVEHQRPGKIQELRFDRASGAGRDSRRPRGHARDHILGPLARPWPLSDSELPPGDSRWCRCPTGRTPHLRSSRFQQLKAEGRDDPSVALDFQDARVDAVCNVNRLQVLRHRKLMGLADVVRIGLVAPFAEPSQDLAVPIELEHHAFHAG